MRLHQYHKKRDFSKSPEPKGKLSEDYYHLYIIQKHAASHLHYDFRLELNGVLLSWAIPKGPSLDPSVKRLAMQVEDHPVEYGNFEGIIPKGQYGGGTVMLWDKGIWNPLDENPEAAYKKGHLRFELNAEKLQGRWDLIRFKDDKHWFLIKHEDDFTRNHSDYDITTHNKSVLSKQTIEEIAKNYQHIWDGKAVKTPSTQSSRKKTVAKKISLQLPHGLTPSSYPDFIPPQLATLVDKPPKGTHWLHEVKFDGYRIIAFKQGNDVVLKSRNNKDWTEELQSVADAIRTLPIKNIIVDGEVVLLDSHGKSDFQLLQNAIKNGNSAPFIYYLFDILYYDQYDLCSLPLIERKSILKHALTFDSNVLYYSDHILNNGEDMFTHSCQLALEGIISKRLDSHYTSKRSRDWLKIKCLKRQEFIIGGYSDPKGERAHFGALFLGVFNEEGTLDYAGNVGTGFTQASLKEIYQRLEEHKSTINPFTTKPPGFTKAHWLKPQLIGEVAFTEWTKEGHLRHPSFKGLRLDKDSSQIVREKEAPVEEIVTLKKSKKEAKKPFIISHPTKILYPEDTITKEDVLTYYESVCDYILPFVSQRPLTLLRCPSTYSKCFYQRHFNDSTQDALHPVDVTSDNESEQYIYLNNREGLLSLVQMGVLEIHPWGSRITNLEHPDIIVIDLDPAPDVPWKKVVAAAVEIKEHLEQFKLRSFVKSTGGKGLHVVIPIQPEYDWDEVKEFTHVFVQFLEKLKPKDFISKMTKSKRAGKIFIDYLRNQRTATAIGTYSTRARLHAPVSTPLFWEELSDRIEDNSFTIKTLPNRLKHLKEDPWQGFWEIKQFLRLDEL